MPYAHVVRQLEITYRITRLLLKSSVEDLEAVKRDPPDVAVPRLKGKRTNKLNPQRRKNMRAAAAAPAATPAVAPAPTPPPQSVGTLPIPNHNTFWNRPASFDHDENMFVY